MASRRRSRFDTIHNPAALMRALRSCRDAMTEASRHLTIGGPVYQATHAITGAIDTLAFLITGEREYFWEKGGGGLTTEAHLEALRKRTARERGELPWE